MFIIYSALDRSTLADDGVKTLQYEVLEGLFKMPFWNFLGGTEENCQYRLAF